VQGPIAPEARTDYSGGIVAVPKVLGVGSLGIAISSLATHLPEAGNVSQAAASQVSVAAGVAVSLRTLKLLGCDTELIGCYGGDALGGIARNLLAKSGIGIGQLFPFGNSSTTVSQVAADGWTRQQYRAHEPNREAFDHKTMALVRDLIGNAQALLLDGSLAWLAADLAEAAHDCRVPVISHISDVREGVGEIIAASDVLIVSERVAGDLSPRGELADAIVDLLAMGPRTVIITSADRGAVARHGSDYVDCAAFSIDALDTYGAGATFVGGFTGALLSSLPLAQCVEIGTAAAALSCQSLGAWDPPISRDAIADICSRRTA
jgi:ribokinase